MNLLIADSGATKTDWLWYDGQEFIRIRTQGLHPSNIQLPQDRTDLEDQIGSLKPDEIRFFGTGCGNRVNDEKISRLLTSIFPTCRTIRVDSDLEGSGQAFFGDGDGIVAVLGTGAISARIEEGRLVAKSASLGFAIGDEGSAADLGRRLLKMRYRNQAVPELLKFLDERLESVDYSEMMNRIYSSPRPNRELAALAGVVLKPPFPAELKTVLEEAFSDFIKCQLTTLNVEDDESVIFTGKVAVSHEDLLKEVMNRHGYKNVEVRYPVIKAWQERISGQKGFPENH
ncbi:MAG: hypothetical protein JJU46_02115 [Balneolaceae bacterium]|nr:hypothetical protein [Balneolaceae bacterium]MCH8547467.1 hypothetical protein [Balneolaceae bacterium]